MKLTNNTILITGGTSVIGRALAEALHDCGNRVIICGRRQSLLDEITASRPGMTGLALDINDASALRRLATELRARFPTLNVLIANAGISRPEDITSDGWDGTDAQAMIETNILGVLRITAVLLPMLKGRPDATIMVTSSNLAFIPRANYPTYCASKAFLHSWLQSLRHQLKRLPIEVLELAPPLVQTELTGAEQAVNPRALPLSDYIAEVMQRLARRDHPRGEVLVERIAVATRARQRGGTLASFPPGVPLAGRDGERLGAPNRCAFLGGQRHWARWPTPLHV